jgi:acyl-CoA thioesterase-1
VTKNLFKTIYTLAASILLIGTLTCAPAVAVTLNILALGASNTNGVGVGTSDAWPAQLENKLRAKGYDAHVTVNAINGQTSDQILGRANYIGSGIQVVVFDTGGDNDRRHGMSIDDTQRNALRIMAAIRSQGAVPIRAPYRNVAGEQYSKGGGYQVDGHHLSAQSHERVAAALVPLVIAAAGKRH